MFFNLTVLFLLLWIANFEPYFLYSFLVLLSCLLFFLVIYSLTFCTHFCFFFNTLPSYCLTSFSFFWPNLFYFESTALLLLSTFIFEPIFLNALHLFLLTCACSLFFSITYPFAVYLLPSFLSCLFNEFVLFITLSFYFLFSYF